MTALGLSVVAFRDGLRPGREAELAVRARALGFAFIEPALRGTRTPSVLPLVDAPTLTTLDLRRYALCADEEASRGLAFEAVERLIEAAARAGGALASFSTGPCNHEDISICIERVRETLARLHSLAATCGVRLALENVPNHLTRSCGPMEALLAAASEVGLCLDFANTLGGADSLRTWFERLENRIVKVHVSDAVRTGEGLRPVRLGCGAVDCDVARAGMSRLGTDVMRVLEFVPAADAKADLETSAAREAAMDLLFR